MHSFLYLASQSERRSHLLSQIGVKHELLLAQPDENVESLETYRSHESPKEYVERVTLAKLIAAKYRLKRRGLVPAPILCADTTVALGECIWGKPNNAKEAQHTLRNLSGQEHLVLTAIAVAHAEQQFFALSISKVTFCELRDCQIQRYVDSLEPFGKAGAYAIQGSAAAWITHIDGSYSGIMGLPLFETCQLLSQVGWSF